MATTQTEAVPVANAVEDIDVQAAFVAEASSSFCPKGHALKYERAAAGTCDGCHAKVAEGKLVSNCGDCNWYLCTTCTPIVSCPSGHQLHTQAAMQGYCDGCSKKVKQGSLVSACQECNWYICPDCQPLMECPKGHALKLWVSQVSGHCDGCGAQTAQGEAVADCRECNYFLCASCHPQSSTRPSELPEEATSLPKCPQGHDVLPSLAGSNCSCDKCSQKIRPGSLASNCSHCNWSLCAECHPIRQCMKGHQLEARQATKGNCDGCGKKVLENQSVLDCRQCNWYLCGTCHMAPVRAIGGA